MRLWSYTTTMDAECQVKVGFFLLVNLWYWTRRRPLRPRLVVPGYLEKVWGLKRRHRPHRTCRRFPLCEALSDRSLYSCEKERRSRQTYAMAREAGIPMTGTLTADRSRGHIRKLGTIRMYVCNWKCWFLTEGEDAEGEETQKEKDEGDEELSAFANGREERVASSGLPDVNELRIHGFGWLLSVGWLVGWSGWWMVDGVWTRLFVLHDVVFSAGGELWMFVEAIRSCLFFFFFGTRQQMVDFPCLSCRSSAQNTSLHVRLVMEQLAGQDKFTNHITIT